MPVNRDSVSRCWVRVSAPEAVALQVAGWMTYGCIDPIMVDNPHQAELFGWAPVTFRYWLHVLFVGFCMGCITGLLWIVPIWHFPEPWCQRFPVVWWGWGAPRWLGAFLLFTMTSLVVMGMAFLSYLED